MKCGLFHLVDLECLDRQMLSTLRQIKCAKMYLKYVIVLACALLVRCKNLPDNTPIISTYAKVAHWGAASSTTTESPPSEARSHKGQTLWTHRSDVKISGGQNLKIVKPKVVYHYPVQKISQSKIENVPGVGEVQERFNPRPYFDYAHVPSKYSNSKSETKPKTDSGTAPTFDSFPVFNKPPAPPTDLYSSQYSSYNPPNAGPVAPPDDNKPDVAYPPNAPPPPGDTDVSPADFNKGYSYNPPSDAPAEPEGPPTYPSLGPPLAPQDDKGNHYYPPSDESNHHAPHDEKEQLYYPPSDDHDQHETILDHPPPGWQEPKPDMGGDGNMDMGGMNGQGMNGQPMMNGAMMNGPQMMNGHAMMNGQDMAEHDLSPPPSPPSQDFGGHFPSYLYTGDHHDFDSYDFDHHHVYKEITTTEMPEDERVNKGHYSYYYLGRKLWYIPLYFSVYFIIYVTVLILKSIARHKIQFKHEHFSRDNEKGRQLNLDEIYENVTTAIDTSRKKFAYIAM